MSDCLTNYTYICLISVQINRMGNSRMKYL